MTAAIAVVALLATGVTAWEIARFATYQVALVLAPGIALYLALLAPREGSWLERCVIGYAAGVAVELASFALASMLGVRGWQFAGPLLILAVAGGIVLARGQASTRIEPRRLNTPALAWGTCAVLSTAVVWFTLGFFVTNPLPRDVSSVVYSQDLVFHLALAGEARERWPIADPNVAGAPLRYHTFANQDVAAISHLTGIPLDVLLFRLWPLSMFLAIAGGTALLTRRVGGSPRVALLAMTLVLLAGELDLDSRQDSPFLGGALPVFIGSPSYLLGAVFFLPTLVLLLGALRRPARSGEQADWTPGIGELALLALLLAGASGSKASILPVVIGGIVVFATLQLILRGRLAEGVVRVGLLVSTVFAASYIVLYRGGGSAGLEFGPLHYGRVVAGFLPGPLASVVGQLGLVGMLTPLVGVLALVVIQRGRVGAAVGFLASTFVAAFLAFSLLSQQGSSEIYFLMYGYLALFPVAALGLHAAWQILPDSRQWRRRWILYGIGASILAAAALNGGESLAAGIVGSRVERAPMFPILATCGLLAAVVLAIRMSRDRVRRREVAAFASLAVVAWCLVDYPLDVASRLVSRWSDGRPAWEESVPGVNNGLTAALRDGLFWLRDNSDPDSVVAVNNFFTYPSVARYFYYGALSQRRTYLGGWEYSERGMRVFKGRPLPSDLQRRAQISKAAAAGSKTALAALRADGVRYLLVDRLNGEYANVEALDTLLRPSFQNHAVSIYDLTR